MVLDVNVVIALASGGHPLRPAATAWWEKTLESGETFTVPDIVWVGFARIVTHQRGVPRPVAWAEAWRFAEAFMAHPKYLRFLVDPRTMEEFVRIAGDAGARGDLVTDAYIAGCAAAYGGTVVTFDRDFRKFDGLRVTELSA
jgi:toxin-antitoxin system PIN domain toxin